MSNEDILLDPEQEKLLHTLHLAHHSFARERRQDFIYKSAITNTPGTISRAVAEERIREGGAIGFRGSLIQRLEELPKNWDTNLIVHPGLPDQQQMDVYQSDIDFLKLQNLISFRDDERFFITPWGEIYCSKMKERSEKGVVGISVDGEAGIAGTDSAVDFAIVTALKIEREAVCNSLGLTSENRIRKGSRVYWRGRLPLGDEQFYEIVVAQCSDMGNVDAAVLTTEMLHHWQPQAMLLVGIAGAASKEQKLGDVVVASDVFYYERGKETPQGLLPELKMIPSDSVLWNWYQALPDWIPTISCPRPGNSLALPKLREGVIASGEKVIAEQAVRDQIARGDRKTQAIEMEGYGFSKAVWQHVERVRHLVIRAICDDATLRKNKKWQPYAAAAAADFVRFYLLDRPLDPQSLTSKKKL